MSIPKLRFEEFTSDWTCFELKNIGLFKKGKGLPKSDITVGGHPCIRYGELYTQYKEIITNIKSKTEVKIKNHVEGNYNDVLIPSSGETAYDIATASALLVNNVILGGDINVFTPNKNIRSQFIAYSINGVNKYKLMRYAEGASVVHLYNNEIGKLKILMPEEDEQQKISDFFTLLDLRIEKQEEKVLIWCEYKKGMIQKLFNKELRFKKEEDIDFPDWEEKTFGTVVANKSNKIKPLNSNLSYCIELDNIESNNGRLVNDYYKIDQKSDKNLFTKDSVLFGKLRPYLRKFLYTDFDGMCSTEIWVLTSKISKLDNKFLYYYIQTNEFLKYANESFGSKMPRADWKNISNITFYIPSEKEQQKIIGFFTVLDLKINKEFDKLDLLEKQKESLLQKMFV